MEQVGDEALSAVAGGVPAMSPAMLDKMYLKKYLPDLYEKLQHQHDGQKEDECYLQDFDKFSELDKSNSNQDAKTQ